MNSVSSMKYFEFNSKVCNFELICDKYSFLDWENKKNVSFNNCLAVLTLMAHGFVCQTLST